MTNTMTHRLSLSPSDANVWTKCKAYAILKAIFPGYKSAYATSAAKKGTSAHTIFENAFKSGEVIDDEAEQIGLDQLRDFLNCETMLLANKMTDVANELLAGKNIVFVEKSFKFKINEFLGGRADYCSVQLVSEDDKKTIVFKVADYKSGGGYVKALDNEQLIVYLILLQDFVKQAFKEADEEQVYKACAKEYHVAIVQPALYNYDVAAYGQSEFEKFRQDILQEAYQLKSFFEENDRNLSEESKLFIDKSWYKTGEHCRYCPQKAHCYKMKQLKQLALKQNLSRADKLELLVMRKTLDKLISQLEDEEILRVCSDPASSPFGVKKARTMKTFKDKEEVGDACKSLGIEAFDRKIKSPAKVLMLLSKVALKTPPQVEAARTIQGNVYQPESGRYNLVLKK